MNKKEAPGKGADVPAVILAQARSQWTGRGVGAWALTSVRTATAAQKPLSLHRLAGAGWGRQDVRDRRRIVV